MTSDLSQSSRWNIYGGETHWRWECVCVRSRLTTSQRCYVRVRSNLVVADVGHELRWIAPAERYEFWKSEVKRNLAISGSRLPLGSFPRACCYSASVWEISGSTQVIVLERHH